MFKRNTKQEYARTFQSIGSDAMGFKGFEPNEIYKDLFTCIRDRDFPLTRLEVICIVKVCLNRWPSQEEIAICNPDGDEATQDYREEQESDYRRIYG